MFQFKLDEDAELRLLEQRHARELFEFVDRNRDHLRDWIPWVDEHTSVQHSEDRIRHDLQIFAENGGFLAGIWVQSRLTGAVGMHAIDWTNKRTDIHYWLDEAFQGRGLVSRSCRALLDHAFNELGLNRIEIFCDPLNTKSRSIPERLGFTQEGILRRYTWKKGNFFDEVVYGMLADEWAALKDQS